MRMMKTALLGGAMLGGAMLAAQPGWAQAPQAGWAQAPRTDALKTAAGSRDADADAAVRIAFEPSRVAKRRKLNHLFVDCPYFNHTRL